MSTSETYKISLFNKALHDRSAFSCGLEGIDNWLKNSISDQIKENRLRVYCAVDDNGRVVGFYALNAHSVRPEEAPALAKKGERHEIPAIYLPSIGVDSSCQGNGLGSALMAHAIRKSVEAADQIGAAAIILDVKRDDNLDRRMKFYTDLGFQLLGGSAELRVFLSMKAARLSVEQMKAAQAASLALIK
ncbi:GNAT family N-acetyltransferase [Paracoccus aestuariivivens]|uniref:GNAT family N-acetyltransferase n=1 Tax=Paracoccus aestuariivivens TaxID=1820333 RepID=A0A6L6JGA1_9RHOB|nr:GNAT family N-acetyltransferase [Paracoccus aestuariivivens]MTH80325.1 GNAT family N-acetyltransferase [Paracoccus aestuariivivens]